MCGALKDLCLHWLPQGFGFKQQNKYEFKRLLSLKEKRFISIATSIFCMFFKVKENTTKIGIYNYQSPNGHLQLFPPPQRKRNLFPDVTRSF
jgi:hypothetical protein